jgi:hypothetical protein
LKWKEGAASEPPKTTPNACEIATEKGAEEDKEHVGSS